MSLLMVLWLVGRQKVCIGYKRKRGRNRRGDKKEKGGEILYRLIVSSRTAGPRKRTLLQLV